MSYHFDEYIDRSGTNAESVEAFRRALFGREAETISFPCPEEELIRMWVADMEFATPEVVIDAIRARLDRRIFGYTGSPDTAYFEAFVSWTKRRYGWRFQQEELVTSKGVVPALHDLVGYLCAPDEKVLIFTPTYAPFRRAVTFHDRVCLCSPLKQEGAHYTMDWEDVERNLADPKVRLCIFCNPHNPTGRLWSREELECFGQLCINRGLWIISDEIHCDLLRSGKQHVPLAKLFPDYDRIVTCMAPSKTFNIAGFMISNIIIPNEELRSTWHVRQHNAENPLSLAAAQAAYEKGEEWLEHLLVYLDGNMALVEEILKAQLPEARFTIPEATYLAWIDLGAYFPPEEHLTRFFATRAGVLLEDGNMFVGNGESHIRLNLALPRDLVREALERICRAVQERG
jgi:cystathionine beta-lyase